MLRCRGIVEPNVSRIFVVLALRSGTHDRKLAIEACRHGKPVFTHLLSVVRYADISDEKIAACVKEFGLANIVPLDPGIAWGWTPPRIQYGWVHNRMVSLNLGWSQARAPEES